MCTTAVEEQPWTMLSLGYFVDFFPLPVLEGQLFIAAAESLRKTVEL